MRLHACYREYYHYSGFVIYSIAYCCRSSYWCQTIFGQVSYYGIQYCDWWEQPPVQQTRAGCHHIYALQTNWRMYLLLHQLISMNAEPQKHESYERRRFIILSYVGRSGGVIEGSGTTQVGRICCLTAPRDGVCQLCFTGKLYHPWTLKDTCLAITFYRRPMNDPLLATRGFTSRERQAWKMHQGVLYSVTSVIVTAHTFSKGWSAGSRFRWTFWRSPVHCLVYDSSTRLMVLIFISATAC